VAVVLNVYSMARLNLGREGGLLVGAVRVEIKAAILAVAAVSALVLVVLKGYVFLKNFVPRFCDAPDPTSLENRGTPPGAAPIATPASTEATPAS
jgi:hypothetical protein